MPDVLLGESREFLIREIIESKYSRYKFSWYGKSNACLMNKQPFKYEWLDESEPSFSLDDMKKMYEYGQSDCGEFGNIQGVETFLKDKFGINHIP